MTTVEVDLGTSFRSLMATFPTGVAVVTAFQDGLPRGMTCSSVCSVSVAPPTLLVCIRESSPTLRSMRLSGAFAVNLLHHHARRTAELFASGDAERFSRVQWNPGTSGPHLAADAHAVADCRIRQTSLVGDHVVVFGEVEKVTMHQGRHVPLLYGMRRFNSWPAH